MKKLLILVLVLAMSVFTFAACKKNEPCAEHVDGDANGICDVCETLYAKPGEMISSAVLSQISDAASMKLDVYFALETNESEWDYEYNEETGMYDIPTNDVDYQSVRANLTIVFSRDDNGSISAKISGKAESKDSPEGEFETEIDGDIFYLIDGVAYTPAGNGVFVKDEEAKETIANIESILKIASEKLSLTPDEKAQLNEALGKYITERFDILDYKASKRFDFAPAINDLFKYVKELDGDTKTVGAVLDDALKLVDEELTSAKLLNELKRVSGLTVNEALAEIDAYLTENHSTTVQGIYDKLANDERLVILLSEIYKLNEPDATEDEVTAAVNEVLTEIKAVKIADLITEAGVGDAVLYDLIVSVVADTPENVPAREDLFTMLEDTLALTLTEAEEALGFELDSIKAVVSGISLNALNGGVDVSFTGLFKVEELRAELHLDFGNIAPASVEGKEDTLSVKLDLTVRLYEISGDAAAIALPEGSTAVYDVSYETFYSDTSEGLYEIYFYDNEDGSIDLNGIIADPEHGTVYVYATVPYSFFQGNTVIISGGSLEFAYNGVKLTSGTETSLVLVLDYTNQTFKVTQIPEYTIQ